MQTIWSRTPEALKSGFAGNNRGAAHAVWIATPKSGATVQGKRAPIPLLPRNGASVSRILAERINTASPPHEAIVPVPRAETLRDAERARRSGRRAVSRSESAWHRRVAHMASQGRPRMRPGAPKTLPRMRKNVVQRNGLHSARRSTAPSRKGARFARRKPTPPSRLAERRQRRQGRPVGMKNCSGGPNIGTDAWRESRRDVRPDEAAEEALVFPPRLPAGAHRRLATSAR